MARHYTMLAAVLVAAAAPLEGQVLTWSARAAGMGGAYGAVGRGAAGALFNPANLGLRGNPGFGLVLPTAAASAGAGPITLRDVKDYAGEVVPDAVKQEWLGRIPAGGALRGEALLDVGAFGMSVGPLAVNVGAVGDMRIAMPREAVELFLFGNAGATGAPADLTLTDGRVQGFAASFAAMSFGQRLLRLGYHDDSPAIAFGVTGKYIVGHGLLDLRDGGGTVTADPITGTFRFPAIAVYDENEIFHSTGWGVDVGVALAGSKLALGLTATDVYNSFAWSPAQTRLRDGRAFLSEDSTSSNFDEQMLTGGTLPDSVVQSVEGIVAAAVFKPAFRLSAAYRPASRILLAVDVLRRTGGEGALQGGRPTTVSAGAELRPLGGIFPLRGGFSAWEGGQAWSVGTGLELGFLNLNAAYGRQLGDVRSERVAVGVAVGSGR